MSLMPRHSVALEDSELRLARKREAVEWAYEKLRKYHVDCRRIVFFKKQKKRSGGYGVVQRAELYQSAYLPSWLASHLNGPPQVVAVKQIRMSAADDPFDLKRAFTKELLVWSGLKDHPGIAKFTGYYADFDRLEAWLLSPWEPHGNVTEFTARRHLEVPERLSLVYDTIDALTFLHQLTPPVCHGDIKSANVLVNANCRAVFCDFGLARIFEDSGFGRLETSTGFKGSIRWCSPELLDGGPRTPNSDVYAWAWLVWEIMTGEMPYQESVAEYSIIRKIFESPRPQVDGEERLSDCLQLWELMTRCWVATPEQRPTSRMCRTTVTFLPRCAPSPEGADPLSPSAELLENLGELKSWKGNYEEGVAHLKTALELYQKKGDDQGIASVLRKQVLVFSRHSRYNEAIELGSVALAKLRALDDDLGVADALHQIGRSLVEMRKGEEARLYLTEALEKFRVHGHDVGTVNCLERLAMILRLEGHHDKALSTLEEALTLAAQSGDKLGEVNVLVEKAYVSWAMGDSPKAAKILTAACDIARRIGDGFGRCDCLEAIATIKLTQGSYEAAEETFQESISVARSINYRYILARSTAKLGETLRRQGRLSEAATALVNACSIYQENSYRGFDGAEAAGNLAQVKKAQGDVEASLLWSGQAIDEYRKLEAWRRVSETLEEMGTIQLNIQRYEEAALSFEAAWIVYHQHGWVWDAMGVASYLAGIPKTMMKVGEGC